ncbi:MAG: fibronectin type III domain-containing protein [Candidatus Sumerlaeaceae bacterium]|nr:fibronectin type III domain-containing protein [Candidatus Sumerlaeaceae bacterium]
MLETRRFRNFVIRFIIGAGALGFLMLVPVNVPAQTTATVAATPVPAPAMPTPDITTTATTPTAVSPAEKAWTEALMKAVTADNYREDRSGAPTICKDLEETVPGRLRSRLGIAETSEIVRFIPTALAFDAPVGRQPSGSLTGRLVFTSGGHGWTHDTSTSLWYTQRPLLFGMVEDFGNLDQINYFADYCFRAGATVVPFRPIGLQPVERILDNATRSGVGFQGPWRDSASKIYYGSPRDAVPYRFAEASLEETAVARYRPVIPRADFYPVYCWARDGADRVVQTYRIVHSGGVTEVRVNHRRVGKGWVYLGQYYFEAGRDGYVEITNKVDDPAEAGDGRVVIADAIRFGNGLGDINRGGGISGFPREEEASLYWVERMIPDEALFIQRPPGRNDQGANVGAPPRMSAYMNRESDGSFFDRIYLGFHSNAIDPAQFKYGRGATGLFTNSPELRTDYQVEWAELVATTINRDFSVSGTMKLPVAYEPFQKLTYSHIDFGEIRRDYLNNEMCATIVEVAFHDNALDATLLRSWVARTMYARSMLKAVQQFLSERDPARPSMPLLPEPPEIVSVRADGTSAALVTWRAPAPDPAGGDPPTGYRVYHSTNGYGFDAGRDAGTALQLRVENLDPAAVHYFRVTAVNAGGESRPSHVLGMAAGADSSARVLVVAGFTSMGEDLNASQSVPLNLHGPLEPGGEFTRVVERLINPRSEVVPLGEVLAVLRRGFDSCTAQAAASRAIELAPFPAVLMEFGRQLPEDGLMTPPLREAVGQYLARGGRLVVFGRHVVKELGDMAQPLLGATQTGETTGATLLVPAGGVTTAPLDLHDGRFATLYRAPFVGELEPAAGAHALFYGAPLNGKAAAVVNGGAGKARTVVFALPAEMIRRREQRVAAIEAAFREIGLTTTPAAEAKPPNPATTGTAEARRERRRGTPR